MRRRCLWLLALFVTLGASAASAGVVVLAYYELGDADPGAAVGLSANGTTLDTAGYFAPAQNLSLTGSAIYGEGVWGGLGVDFAGTGFYSGSAFLYANDDFGIEAWVKPAGTTAYGIVAYQGDTSLNGFGIYQSGDQWSLLYGGVYMADIGAVTPDEWTHIAIVSNAGTTTAYVNGLSVDFGSLQPNTPNANGQMMIGGDPTGDRFSGVIDNVRVFTISPSGSFDPNTDLLVPEPSVWVLAGAGLLALGGILRRRHFRLG